MEDEFKMVKRIIEGVNTDEQKWKEYIDQKLSLLLHELETLNQEILKMQEKLGRK